MTNLCIYIIPEYLLFNLHQKQCTRRKFLFDIDCGIRIAMEVIGGKWKS